MKKEISKKVLAVSIAAAVVAGGLGGAFMFPNQVEVKVPVSAPVVKDITPYGEQDMIKAVNAAIASVEPVVIKENVTVEVEVESENLPKVLQEIYDNDGSVSYLTDDLDDDELEQIVDRIDFANDVKALAVAEVKSELFDELDGEMVGLIELDEDEMERLRVDDDSDEVLLSDVEYEDKDADVSVTGTFEQDDVKYDYEVLVEIKDNEVDDFEIVSVTAQ